MYKNYKAYICLSVIILIFFITMPVFATNLDAITKIENNLFGFDYSGDSNQARVARLEKTIYGKVSSGDINKRIKKISEDISADVIGLELPPVKDTFLAQENEELQDSTVNYPIVDEIELKLFKQTYKNRDFHTRIVTIEKKLFGKIYDVDDYPTRMDRIKAKIMPNTLAKEEIEYDEEYIDYKNLNSNDLGGTKKSWFSMPFGQRKYSRPYTNYGEYGSIDDAIRPRDNLNDDLTQMEYDMFGTEFSSDDTQTRIKRLNSVNKAKKSSQKYDSQKFSQRMSTAMEIGAMILMILAMVL